MAWWGPRYSGAVVVVEVAGLEYVRPSERHAAPRTERLEISLMCRRYEVVSIHMYLGRGDLFERGEFTFKIKH